MDKEKLKSFFDVLKERWLRTEEEENRVRQELKAVVDAHKIDRGYVKVALLTLTIPAKKNHCCFCRFLILSAEHWCALYSEGLKKENNHDIRCEQCLQDFGE